MFWTYLTFQDHHGALITVDWCSCREITWRITWPKVTAATALSPQLSWIIVSWHDQKNSQHVFSDSKTNHFLYGLPSVPFFNWSCHVLTGFFVFATPSTFFFFFGGDLAIKIATGMFFLNLLLSRWQSCNLSTVYNIKSLCKINAVLWPRISFLCWMSENMQTKSHCKICQRWQVCNKNTSD